jgi:hypothetical protein
MGSSDERFDVYVCTRSADLTLVRAVGLRAAQLVARHHADARGQRVFILNRATNSVEAVAPSPARERSLSTS